MTEIIDAWAIFFKSFSRLHNLMEEELKIHGFPSLEVYDVLWTLEQAKNHSLRLNELGQKVYIAKFNISRIVDRLVEQNLLIKEVCSSDKRGIFATLTIEGIKLRRNIWAIYGHLIQQHFSVKLTQADHQRLKKILSKLSWQ